MIDPLSAEQWIGNPPKGWRRSRIRNVATLSPPYSSSRPEALEPCTVAPMEALSTDGKIDVSDQQPFIDISNGLSLFEKGDVLFAKITPCMENGKGALVTHLPTRYGFGSTEFHVLRPTGAVDGKFLYYATFNPVFRSYAAENMVGAAGQKRVSSRLLKDTRLYLPRIDEQRRIAEYLDQSCTAIDNAIEGKTQQLDVLAGIRKTTISRAVTIGLEKDVRVRQFKQDWLTTVPSHWEMCRIKRVIARMDYGISVSTEPDGKYPVLKMANLQDGEITFEDLDFVDEIADDLLLETGDVLYNRTNSADQVGKAALFRKARKDAITFASYLVRLRANHRINPYFLNYVVNSDGFLSFARKLAIPSVQQSNLNSTRYGQIFIPLPPKPEQTAICDYLDQKVEQLQHIVQAIEKQITTLIAYRESLIHEYVTGRCRVPIEVAQEELVNA